MDKEVKEQKKMRIKLEWEMGVFEASRFFVS